MAMAAAVAMLVAVGVAEGAAPSFVSSSSLCTKDGGISSMLSPVLRVTGESVVHRFSLPAGASGVTISAREAGGFQSSLPEFAVLVIEQFNVTKKCISARLGRSEGACSTALLVTGGEKPWTLKAALVKPQNDHPGSDSRPGHHVAAAVMVVSYTCRTAERRAPNGKVLVYGTVRAINLPSNRFSLSPRSLVCTQSVLSAMLSHAPTVIWQADVPSGEHQTNTKPNHTRICPFPRLMLKRCPVLNADVQS